MIHQILSILLVDLFLMLGATSPDSATTPVTGGSWFNVTGNLSGMASECGNSTLVSAVPNSMTIIGGVALKGLWASTIDGVWAQMGKGLGSDVITNRPSWIAYDPNNPSVFWEAGIYNGFGAYRTTNGGSTFQHLGSMTHDDFISVDLTDVNRKTLLAGGHEQSQRVMKSADGGQTWTNIGLALPEGTGFSTSPLAINSQTYVVNTNTSWGSGTPGIYRTVNSGASWTKVSSADAFGQPLVTTSGAIYWPLTNGTLAKSVDAGATWSIVGSGLQNGNPVRPVEMPDHSIVAAASSLMISANGGATWTELGPALPFKAVSLDYSPQRQGFYISHFDCGNAVLSNAFMKLAYSLASP
jgi:hypothetical protein